MEILSEFPHLLPQDRHLLHYDGYITICKQSFRLEIIIPQSNCLGDASVFCDWKLQQCLGNSAQIIKQRLSQCDSLVDFLREIQSIAERQLEGSDDSESVSSVCCTRLISHIETLGWDKLVYIDPSFTNLHLQYTDIGSRKHILKLNVPNNYPDESPQCSTELPCKLDIHWNPECEIGHIYDQYTEAVGQYQDFWDMMSEIDQHTWVLEPEKPTYSARHRRIAISTSVSIQITVNPCQPRLLPECKFLGADQAIAPIRQNMNSNLNSWDESIGLLDNLQTLLSLTFPSSTNSKIEEFNAECGICYSYRMEAEIPDEVCNDTRCAQAFHKSCLIEWLRALPSSRQSFNTIFGNCPYCEKAITVKMVTT